MTSAVSRTETAASLAALLPGRRGVAWTVGPAPLMIRANAVTTRLDNGTRALDIVELDGRIEVYADRPGQQAAAPDAVIAQSGPDAVAVLADRILRVVLPRLDREAARATLHAHGREHIIIDAAHALNDVTTPLIEHGVRLELVGRLDGVGVTWNVSDSAEWGLWALGDSGNLTLTYDGPVSGLYALLPVLLPPSEGHEPADSGSAFTRHLTDRFPQLQPLSADEVEFGGRDVRGYIALPAKDEPTDRADDSRRVVAEFSQLGPELLITAVAHLI